MDGIFLQYSKYILHLNPQIELLVAVELTATGFYGSQNFNVF